MLTSLVVLTLRSSLFLAFIFQRSVTLRLLHSFPTRRSSDLSSSNSNQRRACIAILSDRDKVEMEDERSEEYTSELQSLTNLVCRLLLEKKNKYNYQHEVNSLSKRQHAVHTPDKTKIGTCHDI